MSSQAIIEGEVRELVRRRGIDPVADPGLVRDLVAEVLADYQDRSAISAMPTR